MFTSCKMVYIYIVQYMVNTVCIYSLSVIRVFIYLFIYFLCILFNCSNINFALQGHLV